MINEADLWRPTSASLFQSQQMRMSPPTQAKWLNSRHDTSDGHDFSWKLGITFIVFSFPFMSPRIVSCEVWCFLKGNETFGMETSKYWRTGTGLWFPVSPFPPPLLPYQSSNHHHLHHSTHWIFHAFLEEARQASTMTSPSSHEIKLNVI